MVNQDISRLFAMIADALEFKGANRFRVNAYRRGAEVVADLPEEVTVLLAEKRLTKIPGIGKGMAWDIEEFVARGEMSSYREAMEGVPSTLLALRGISGLGPKRLALLHEKLGISDLPSLEQALESGTVAALPGMGERTAENLRRGVERYARTRARMLLAEALALSRQVHRALAAEVDMSRAVFAGSFRRGRETCGDLDLLLPGKDGGKIIRAFTRLPGVERVLAAGETKGSVVFEGGRQVDLRVVPKESLGAALCYFTGSKEHNVRLREIAKKKGLKVNEYGVFRGETCLAGKTEKEIYEALDLPWIPPELREDRGEIEAAREGRLPEILEAKHLRGDLHVHTSWSSGKATVLELVREAKNRGYKYVAITDHSQNTVYARGLGPERWAEQAAEVEAVRAQVPGIKILHGMEVDIGLDGELDLPETLQRELDWMVAGVHSGFRENVTERILQAVRNPNVDVIAHPTGRKLGQSVAYEGYDLDAVIEAAAETGTALELNGSPERLDLSAELARKAAGAGVLIAIGSGANHPGELEHLELGVRTARRGWLTPDNVLNTRPVSRLRKRLKK